MSDFIQTALPDTPLMRQWRAKVFTGELQDPACRLLGATTNTQIEIVVGMVSLRMWVQGDSLGGF